jgi:hypothetical protein
VLLWLGALIVAVLAIAAIAALPPVHARWRGLGAHGKLLAGAIAIVVVAVATNFFHATVSTTGESAPLAPDCVLEGQVFDLDGSPLRGALILARPQPRRLASIEVNAPDYIVATTDARGRFRGDCSDLGKPSFLSVNFQQRPGDSYVEERCEWWSIRDGEITDHRLYSFNIEIPVDAVTSNEWFYEDDYRCSDSPRGPNVASPGG